MARNSYTYTAAWTAKASNGDFERIQEARSLVEGKRFPRPKEREMLGEIIIHLLGTMTAEQLCDAYCDAVRDAVKAKAAAKAAATAELAKKRLAEIEAEAANLRAQLNK